MGSGFIRRINRRVARLEMRIDHLETQFDRLNELLIEFGFESGIRTLAESLDEAMEIQQQLDQDTA